MVGVVSTTFVNGCILRTKTLQRGGRGRLNSSAKRAPNNRDSRSPRVSRSNLAFPLPPLCTPATQAKS